MILDGKIKNMADYEVSKIMWIAIVVALAASIFVIAKPQVQTQANEVFGKISSVTKGIRVSETLIRLMPIMSMEVIDLLPLNLI